MTYMTFDEAYEYLNRHGWSKTKLGFERAKALLAALGDPQKKLKFIHVAGTNGKGSTCAMLESIMRRAGYTTGLFPSPFIEDFTERIQINGKNIARDDLARLTQTVAEAADKFDDHPGHFELITAIGMLYFVEKGCDIVILEVGMGGEKDATNVIDAPEAAVICNIGLDHTEYLGDTVEKIAAVKAGIIKTGADVVVYDNIPSVIDVVADKAAREHCTLHLASDIEIKPVSSDLRGQRFSAAELHEQKVPAEHVEKTTDINAGKCTAAGHASSAMPSSESVEGEYTLSLLGRHQLKNTQVVLKTIEVMRQRGWKISREAVREGLARVEWPVRFEVMSYDPVFIIDGGHNPQCAQAMGECIAEYFPGQKVTMLIGMLADKDYKTTISQIVPYAAECVTITPDNSLRALSAEDLAETVREAGCPAQAVDEGDPVESVKAAIKLALSKGRPVVAFGSLYAAGTIRSCYREYLL